MEFEVDQVQDGRFRLARRVLVTEAPPRGGQDEERPTMLSFAVVGMAGAIVFNMMLGNGRKADPDQPPLGWADAGAMVTLDAVPHGLDAHAYRPWPSEPHAEMVPSLVLHGGKAYVSNLDRIGMVRSFPLLAAFTEGHHGALWSALDALYRDEFEAALPPAVYTERLRRDAALAAYERAAAGPEQLEASRTLVDGPAEPTTSAG
jgi:hypothetical protein